MSLKADAVFEGGGVKGIGLAGAIYEVEKAGYEFENIAGTSAGAIVASLLAAGYTAEEIKKELKVLDYLKFKDEGFLDKFWIPGKALSICFEYGIYEGAYFEIWLEQRLRQKGKTVFGDIRTVYPEEKYRYKLQVIAADITDRRLLVIPGDLKDFGCDPDKFSISRAVRMSMSIPFFFEPVRLQDGRGRTHFIVDGGVLSNYPVWLLDDGTSDPPWPTFGFKLIEPDKRAIKPPDWNPIKNPIAFGKAIVTSMIEAHDNYHISRSKGDYDRTVRIPTVVKLAENEKAVKATDFDISGQESEALFQNGQAAAIEFLSKWNFDNWKKLYRQNPA
jgi:NTE family protein